MSIRTRSPLGKMMEKAIYLPKIKNVEDDGYDGYEWDVKEISSSKSMNDDFEGIMSDVHSSVISMQESERKHNGDETSLIVRIPIPRKRKYDGLEHFIFRPPPGLERIKKSFTSFNETLCSSMTYDLNNMWLRLLHAIRYKLVNPKIPMKRNRNGKLLNKKLWIICITLLEQNNRLRHLFIKINPVNPVCRISQQISTILYVILENSILNKIHEDYFNKLTHGCL